VDTVRGAVITSLRERRVRVADLRAELVRHSAVAGRARLAELVDLVEQGCQSELEIWGVRQVLTAAGMPRFVQQHPVALPFGTVHLDAALPELKIAVEMDGAAYHGSREDRERDIRRDAALAARGWIVLRFSYRRLPTRAGGVPPGDPRGLPCPSGAAFPQVMCNEGGIWVDNPPWPLTAGLLVDRRGSDEFRCSPPS